MLSAKSQILCVDDESCYEMLDVLLNLEKPIYHLVGTNSVDEALEMIANKKFDLYLLECFLPGKSGVELCQQIRQTDAETPVLFYSVMARPIDRRRAMEAGATEYLVKPNDINRLAETIGRLVNRDSTVFESEFTNGDGIYGGLY